MRLSGKIAPALLTAAFALVGVSAAAQTPPMHYDLHAMSFDMWCQEVKHYPPERCDKRLAADDDDFQNYRKAVENYEIRRQQNQRQEQEWNRSILQNDPVDNPTRPGTAPPGSAGTIPNP
jgi:hypothetical protein